MNEEFFEAVKLIEKEKEIPADYLFEKIKNAIIVSVRHMFGGEDVVFCDVDPDKKELKVYAKKTVKKEVENPNTEISVEDAKKYKKSPKDGDTVEIKLETKDFGRIAAQTAKHVIRQGIRDAEKGQIMQEFQDRSQKIVTARVQNIDPVSGNVNLEIGKAEALLLKNEQIPGETFAEGQLVKIYVVDVNETERGPRIIISRKNPDFVKCLFENEVPEIQDGTVEIKGVSREAGSRSKLAVYSVDENVDPVGACIGPKGQRVNDIVEILNGEKIDIIEYSDDIEDFVSAALAPSDVVDISIVSEEERSCKVIVPDDQLSLAIGNKGQNVRLAARLTGWKIDISSESGATQETD